VACPASPACGLPGVPVTGVRLESKSIQTRLLVGGFLQLIVHAVASVEPTVNCCWPQFRLWQGVCSKRAQSHTGSTSRA